MLVEAPFFRASFSLRRRSNSSDISFGWGYATVSLQTKKIKGLHENDFIMAAKLDQLAHAGLTTRPIAPTDLATALVASDKQLTHSMD